MVFRQSKTLKLYIFKRADGFTRVYDCISFMRHVSRPSHELRRSESKMLSATELSKNIGEKRCELKASEPVNERSERASGYIVGYNSKIETVL